MSTDSPPKKSPHPVGVSYTTSDYLPPTVPQPAMPTIKFENATTDYWPRKPDNQTFKVGENVRLPNKQIKKVRHVKDDLILVNGYSMPFFTDEVEKVTK